MSCGSVTDVKRVDRVDGVLIGNNSATFLADELSQRRSGSVATAGPRTRQTSIARLSTGREL